MGSGKVPCRTQQFLVNHRIFLCTPFVLLLTSLLSCKILDRLSICLSVLRSFLPWFLPTHPLKGLKLAPADIYHFLANTQFVLVPGLVLVLVCKLAQLANFRKTGLLFHVLQSHHRASLNINNSWCCQKSLC